MFFSTTSYKDAERSKSGGTLRGILLVFVTSLFTFTILDSLFIIWFVQWDGVPFPYPQNVILLVAIIIVRTIVVEGIMSRAFGGPFKKENFLLSLIVFSPPLIIIQFVTGVRAIFELVSSISPFAPRTFLYAVFSFLTLFLLLEFSRLFLIYLIRRKYIQSRLKATRMIIPCI